MSKKMYVFSKLANHQKYATYTDAVEKNNHAMPVEKHAIIIKGGAGLANDHFVTPLGVATEVTEEDVMHLRAHETFKLHEKNGFVKIEEKNHDVEKVVGDMTSDRDQSSPLTPSDYEQVNAADVATPQAVQRGNSKRK